MLVRQINHVVNRLTIMSTVSQIVFCFILSISLVHALKNICEYGCGKASESINGREIHGWKVTIKTIKFHSGTTSECIGTIISDRHVVTSAHCLYDYELPVIVDKINISHEKIPESLKVQYFTAAPGFVDRHLNEIGQDIAIIKLARPLPLSEQVSPICTTYVEFNPRLLGNDFVVFMNQVPLPLHLVETKHCENTLTDLYGGFWSKIGLKRIHLPKSDWCVNAQWYPQECVSGGAPIMWRNPEGRWFFIGVTSRGRVKCGDFTLHPGVMTNVPKYFKDYQSYLSGEVYSACYRDYDGTPMKAIY